MLKKLRRKIVFTNMVLVGLVLVLVFTSFGFISAKVTKATLAASIAISVQTQDLDEAQRHSQFFPQWNNGSLSGEWNNPMDDFGQDTTTPEISIPESADLLVALVCVDNSGNILSVGENSLNLSEEELSQAVQAALENSTEGIQEIQQMSLFYRCTITEGKTYIAFVSSTDFKADIRTMVSSFIFLWVMLMVLFFIISEYMARISLRPVEKAWKQQQAFVADASHELKTPLAVILANNNILLSDGRDLSPSNRKWVESTQEEALHMQTLLEHLLFLARSDSGDQRMLISQVNLSDMLEEDVLQFEPLAYERGVTIDAQVSPQILLQGDATMMKQLIHILLDNACKYAPQGSVVHASLTAERNGCLLKVNNSGDPIDPEELPHIFERFYRTDKVRTITDDSSGFGLGLAIAKSIVEDHRGTIQVTSTQEEGTTFIVRFKGRG